MCAIASGLTLFPFRSNLTDNNSHYYTKTDWFKLHHCMKSLYNALYD